MIRYCDFSTIMLRGAAKTQTEKTAQIHPTIVTRVLSLANIYVKATIAPNDPIFNRRTSFVV